MFALLHYEIHDYLLILFLLLKNYEEFLLTFLFVTNFLKLYYNVFLYNKCDYVIN